MSDACRLTNKKMQIDKVFRTALSLMAFRIPMDFLTLFMSI